MAFFPFILGNLQQGELTGGSEGQRGWCRSKQVGLPLAEPKERRTQLPRRPTDLLGIQNDTHGKEAAKLKQQNFKNNPETRARSCPKTATQ